MASVLGLVSLRTLISKQYYYSTCTNIVKPRSSHSLAFWMSATTNLK